MNYPFSSELHALCAAAESIAHHVILPNAEEVDRECRWPQESLHALAEAGLTGLTVPARLGGHGQGMLGLAALTEVVGKACASTAMCFGMHCVATAVIAAKATRRQEERYLTPIAAGEHITTLALSEAGTGSHFFIPETKLERSGDSFVVSGVKQFVTSGGHADSYVVSTLASTEAAVGEFSCLVIERTLPGLRWAEPWCGFGMRGNSSSALLLEQVRVPVENLLGQEGEQAWYVFEVVAPFFLTAMAGTYLGVAQAALDLTVQHLKARRHSHTAQPLAEVQTLQHRLGEMWTAVERSRLLLYQAARLGDLGNVNAITSILACKADAADTAVWVTNEAMTLCGGAAYRENSTLARLLRDARASHVMAPTTEMLKVWTGRTALGLPLL